MLTVEQLQNRFKAYLAAQSFEKTPPGLYKPVDYIMHLGGKHIRPVMLLMAHNLFKEDIEEALSTALAIEMFHNFTLLHDDVMDNAAMRRGKPTVHTAFGTNAAIPSGDVMLIKVYELLTRSIPPHLLPTVLQVFNQVAIDVCEGQQMDMDFEKRPTVAITEYLEMITLKTAVLLAGALKIGALSGGATPANAHRLYQFGKHIGIAFQIQDDLLDTFGDSAVFGKKIGGDIVQNKKTYLYLKARQEANEPQLAQLDHYYTGSNQDEAAKIKEVTEIFKDLKVDQDAEQLKEKHLQMAFEALNEVNVAEVSKRPLRWLAEKLMGRKN